MSVRIVALGTALPPFGYAQADVKAVMRRWIGGERRVDRTLERVYAGSGISRRWSVLPDFMEETLGGAARGADLREPAGDANAAPTVTMPQLFSGNGGFCRPTTGARNDRYGACAPPLLERAARRALAAAPASLRERVTHVVTVSCTGFQAPGVDDHLVRALALPATTERYHLGFMGCYAAFPALRMARAFCLADPAAVVLVASVELCTLHLDPSRELDSILATSVFADGAAAALVTAVAAPDAREDALQLEVLASATTLTQGGKQDMAWTIGDHGFEMVLTSYVPRVLEAEAETAVAPLLRAGAVSLDEIDAWAVHPGGRAILDRVEAGLRLPATAMAASREVLATAGNMSSASVLFVLQGLLGGRCEDLDAAVEGAGAEDAAGSGAAGAHAACAAGAAGAGAAGVAAADRVAPGSRVAALAFGPGLTVDSALLRVVAP